ncbi:unnamed protein product, partial [Sphacelaria rigidula]
MANEPKPLTEEQRHILGWEAATERLIASAKVTVRESRRRRRELDEASGRNSYSIADSASVASDTTIAPLPPKKNQPKSVTKNMDIQRLMFGFRLDEAPYMGDIGDNESKRRNSQLLVVLGFLQFDLREDFASPNQALFQGGATVENVFVCGNVYVYFFYKGG